MVLRGWSRILIAAVLAVAVASFVTSVSAADGPPKWDPTKTTAPVNVAELKALQSSVKAVVDKVTPATVAVQYQQGAGSGVIVSADGIVLTAGHVVTPMRDLFGFGSRNRRDRPDEDGPPPKDVFLMLPDGKMVKAVVLGRNKSMDSAILKITGKIPTGAKWPGADKGEWPHVELGKSGDVKPGQWVVSLGHPGGPKQERRPPVRLGQVEQAKPDGERIQTDCTLVGGDSGGPLFDLDGKLIGIHTSIGDVLTKNYHVPTKMFQRDWEKLTRGDNMGMTSDAYIGIGWKSGDEPIIDEVKDKSPAADAGLQSGDRVLKLNGVKIKSNDDVNDVLTGLRSGQRVEIHVQRGEDVYELELTLAKRKK